MNNKTTATVRGTTYSEIVIQASEHLLQEI